MTRHTLLGGLLPGSCVNLFLRFSYHWQTCTAVSVLHWLVWLWQFWRGTVAIDRVFKKFPGYSGITTFFYGVCGLCAIQPKLPGDGIIKEMGLQIKQELGEQMYL